MKLALLNRKNKEKKPKKKKSVLREWVDAIVFAVIAATIIRWALLSAYTIPTASMEGTQLVGDFLFVSKVSYGPRTPITLLRLPLTDNKIWGTNTPSYLDWIQLPFFRLPSFYSIDREDIVVFNWPEDVAPIDMKTHYIKRCVAVAGDTLQIKAGQVHINGKASPIPEDLQYKYTVRLKDGTMLTDRVVERYELEKYFSPYEVTNSSNTGEFDIFTSLKKADELKKLSVIKSIKTQMAEDKAGDGRMFVGNELFDWNEDFFGPLLIPYKGLEIDINAKNLAMYGKNITRFEYNKDVKIEGGKLFIEGKEITKYTFKQDYYFMMGDNRHNSLDSRFWGFVPKDHVVGEAFVTWLSLNYDKSMFSRVRWNRVFKLIR